MYLTRTLKCGVGGGSFGGGNSLSDDCFAREVLGLSLFDGSDFPTAFASAVSSYLIPMMRLSLKGLRDLENIRYETFFSFRKPTTPNSFFVPIVWILRVITRFSFNARLKAA